jgi:hypothetical protein
MVSPGAVVAHRTPAQYRTVMVPQTVMVAREGVQVRAHLAAICDARAGRDGLARLQLLRAGGPALRELRLLSEVFCLG